MWQAWSCGTPISGDGSKPDRPCAVAWRVATTYLESFFAQSETLLLTFQQVECVPFCVDTSHREERPWNDR